MSKDAAPFLSKNKIKVLHVVSQDSGGAGRAALRLHRALLSLESDGEGREVDSLMIVQNKSGDDPGVIPLATTKFKKLLSILRPHLSNLPLRFYPRKLPHPFSFDPIPNRTLVKTIRSLKPDVVHLHRINDGFLRISDLKKLKVPLVWSLHDSNAFGGGCHYMIPPCEKSKTQCQKCPLLNSPFKHDLSWFAFRQKRKIYPALNLTINGLSAWIAKRAKESALFKDKPVIRLPNPIDVELYAPIDKAIAKTLLNVPKNRKIIAFGAIDAVKNADKGSRQLKEALNLLKNKENLGLIVFGASANEKGQKEDVASVPTIYSGRLNDDLSLRILYNAADMVVMPSLSENLSNVIMESLACGTPVIAFDVGGNCDMVEHLQNGYLAKPFDSHDLAKGIEWVLSLDVADYEALRNKARRKILKTFEAKTVAKKYLKLYKGLL